MTEEQREIANFYDYLLEVSIEHYEDIIDWAVLSDYNRCDLQQMNTDTGTCIGECSCILCTYFLRTLYESCKECPLNLFGERCISEDRSLWWNIRYEKEMPQWIIYANQLRDFMIDIREALAKEIEKG